MSALKDLSQPLVGFPEEAEKEHTIFANDSDSGIRDSFDTEEHFPQGYGLMVLASGCNCELIRQEHCCRFLVHTLSI